MLTIMGQRRFLFLLLPALSIHGSSFPELDMENTRVCPYPWPENIYPCVCKENEKFQVFVTCNMNSNVDKFQDQILILEQAFRCNNEIFSLDINLNGYNWGKDISAKNVGRFKMSYFRLFNFSSIEGFVKPGAFSLSKESLMGIKIEKKIDDLGDRHDRYTGNPDSGVESGAFSDLPFLTSLTIDGLEKIYPEAFSKLPNLRELTLSRHGMERLVDNTFIDLPSLAQLNLRNNKKMKNIGNLLSNLQNPDLAIDLTQNMIEELRQENFKPFLDNIIGGQANGYIDLMDNPLQCGCDTMWYVSSLQRYQDLLRNAHCMGPLNNIYQNSDISDINKLDSALLERACPDKDCPNYDPGSGRMIDSEMDTSVSLKAEDYPVIPPNMTKCPFPLSKDSHPCHCYLNPSMDIFVDCNITTEDNAWSWLPRLTQAFGCRTRIKQLNVEFKEMLTLYLFPLAGELEITTLKISGEFYSQGRYSVEIEPDAFNSSLSTLEEITIGNKVEIEEFQPSSYTSFSYLSRYRFSEERKMGEQLNIERGRSLIHAAAFSDMPKLKSVTFGNIGRTYLSFQAFKNLPKLKELNFANYTIFDIESEAFTNLPALEYLDLSNQLFGPTIPTRAFYNMTNLKEITLERNIIWKINTKAFEKLPSLEYLDLSQLGIETISNEAFYDLPKLTQLNLRNNNLKKMEGNIFYNTPVLVSLDFSSNYELEYIGTVLEAPSANAHINLTMTAMKTIPESSFKIFFENVLQNDGEGRIDMEIMMEGFRCSCDIKWLLVSKMDVSNILSNINCADGNSIDEVDLDFLIRRCPSNSCPHFDGDFWKTK